MKTIHLLSKLFAYCCMLLIFMVSACKPDEAVDETKHKLHEDPVKAVFTLYEGTIKDNKPFSNKLILDDFLTSKTEPQQIVWQITPQQGWHVSSKQKHFKVKSIQQSPMVVYLLSIDYYNTKGEKINHQFFDLGQDKIHQHFFSIYKTETIRGKKVRTREQDKSKLPLNYCYTDQYNGVNLGTTNPIGFNGLLQIVHQNEPFILSVDLLHAAQSKYDSKNQLSPFYLPAKSLISTGQWDITVSIPFDVDGMVASEENKVLDETLFQPKTVEITIYEGHLHGPMRFHQNTFSNNNKYFGKHYLLKYTLQKGKWVANKDNDKCVNVLGNKDKFAVYAFSLRYFDEQHKDITNKIVDNDEDQHYQHFFTLSNIKPSYGGIALTTDKNDSEFFEYTYCDTNPWNKTNHFDNAPFIGDKNPIGLKGYFAFKYAHKQFTLNIQLMRAKQSKAVNGKHSLFCQPSQQQLSNEAWMPTIHIPINVYMDVEDKELDYDIEAHQKDIESIKLTNLSPTDQRKVLSLQKAFDITNFTEALEEFLWLIVDSPKHNGSGFWF